MLFNDGGEVDRNALTAILKLVATVTPVVLVRDGAHPADLMDGLLLTGGSGVGDRSTKTEQWLGSVRLLRARRVSQAQRTIPHRGGRRIETIEWSQNKESWGLRHL